MRRHRGRIGFVMDEARHYTHLDRNHKARLLHIVEIYQRASKARGCRNGLVTQPGLIVLRCLLLQFHSLGIGRCNPTYDSIQARTGLCRQSIAKGLAILERIWRVDRDTSACAGQIKLWRDCGAQRQQPLRLQSSTAVRCCIAAGDTAAISDSLRDRDKLQTTVKTRCETDRLAQGRGSAVEW